jgi:hypothetical protein
VDLRAGLDTEAEEKSFISVRDQTVVIQSVVRSNKRAAKWITNPKAVATWWCHYNRMAWQTWCPAPFYKFGFGSNIWWNSGEECMKGKALKLWLITEYGGSGCEWSGAWMLILLVDVLHCIVNMCTVNSCILCKVTGRPSCTAHGNRQMSFRRNALQQLIITFTSQKRTGGKRNMPIGTPFAKFLYSEKIASHGKVCALCI